MDRWNAAKVRCSRGGSMEWQGAARVWCCRGGLMEWQGTAKVGCSKSEVLHWWLDGMADYSKSGVRQKARCSTGGLIKWQGAARVGCCEGGLGWDQQSGQPGSAQTSNRTSRRMNGCSSIWHAASCSAHTRPSFTAYRGEHWPAIWFAV
ncbi:hypothetical protein DUNSADRAFT_8106 [Dunaliella salina]|uniref:Encoded protein n=1 Tax=Dunaliella salina TaxID=3046 RepID=A0ABQ7GK25_DUNSA|nr:hypothetical protein DUNSADRAFT_8106 [Dunaliella salina]|eukprot:KAF5834957.1 hypothetical protein DUNSADRAFT_8106 [Dunaliella salina]